MKLFLIFLTLTATLFAWSDDLFTVCAANDVALAADGNACQLGHRVIQGIILKNKDSIQQVDAKSMIEVLRSGDVILSKKEYEGAQLEEKANMIFKGMAKKANQPIGVGVTAPNSIVDTVRRSSVLSTGTRGGGYNDGDFNLSLDLWY